MFDKICLWLVIIGALNWGFIGLFNVDLVALIFGTLTYITRAVYAVVGLAALWIALKKLNIIKN